MRNRDFFIPSITTLILFGFVWFLSCAHQNRWKEEADIEFSETAEDPGNYAENADIPGTDKPEALAAEGPSSEAAPEEASNAPSDGFSYESDSSDSAFSLEEDSAPTDSLAQKPSEAPAPETAPSAESVPPVASAPSIDQSLSAPAEAEVDEIPAPIEESVDSEDSEAAPAPKKRVSWTGKLPVIPSKAVTRKGTKLNRFYFARLGDSPKSVSNLIYSDTKHAKKLASWNGGNWKPGQLIYYLSPIEPKDSRMDSYYKENNIQPEEYSIKPGDWLTRIAKLKLGSTFSWKEIGVVNGLKRPNALEVGERLAIYPRNLLKARRKAPEQLAQAPRATPEPSQQETFETEPLSPPPAQVAPAPIPQPQFEAQPQPEVQPQAQVAPPPAPEPSAPFEEASNTGAAPGATEMDWNQLIEQESLAILIGAALVILLLALKIRKKRLKNKSGSSGSSDEGYQEEPSSKFGKGR